MPIIEEDPTFCPLRYTADENTRDAQARAVAAACLILGYGLPAILLAVLQRPERQVLKLQHNSLMPVVTAGVIAISFLAFLVALTTGSMEGAAAFATIPLAVQGSILVLGQLRAGCRGQQGFRAPRGGTIAIALVREPY